MSVKSTEVVTRGEIINHIINRLNELNRSKWAEYSNEELENIAEELDEKCGDPFTNYLIDWRSNSSYD